MPHGSHVYTVIQLGGREQLNLPLLGDLGAHLLGAAYLQRAKELSEVLAVLKEWPILVPQVGVHRMLRQESAGGSTSI